VLKLHVRFEVFMAVTMKIAVYLDVMSYILVDIHQHFGGTAKQTVIFTLIAITYPCVWQCSGCRYSPFCCLSNGGCLNCKA
jgi:hypothetical protein